VVTVASEIPNRSQPDMEPFDQATRRPDLRTALLISPLVGSLGVDRLASGDLMGGLIKFFFFVLLMPLALLWNLVDFVHLLVADRFFIGPQIQWAAVPRRHIRAAKIGAGILWAVLFVLSVVSSILVGAAVRTGASESSTKATGSGAAMEFLDDDDNEGNTNRGLDKESQKMLRQSEGSAQQLPKEPRGPGLETPAADTDAHISNTDADTPEAAPASAERQPLKTPANEKDTDETETVVRPRQVVDHVMLQKQSRYYQNAAVRPPWMRSEADRLHDAEMDRLEREQEAQRHLAEAAVRHRRVMV